ncbi:MAG: hypothetical protein IVW54_03155 [Candidatus Binataceae bacterium]|nr:hypothetical protein [Candidatus Binataceae bacterium]
MMVLIAMEMLGQRLSTGWRLYVLDRVLKAAWAGTISVVIGTIVAMMLELGGLARMRISILRIAFEGLRALTVLTAAAGALGYFMPDWTPLSTAAAALVLLLWLLTGASAMTLRWRSG